MVLAINILICFLIARKSIVQEASLAFITDFNACNPRQCFTNKLGECNLKSVLWLINQDYHD